MNIGDRIKSRREELGMSQDELAEKMGYKTRSTIAKIETGKNKVTTNNAEKLAKILNTSLSYIMGWEDESSHKQPLIKHIEMYTGNTTDYMLDEINKRDYSDISKRLTETLSLLEDKQNALMFDGQALDDTTRELLKASLENSLKIGKINAKEKFTPKKYKKD